MQIIEATELALAHNLEPTGQGTLAVWILHPEVAECLSRNDVHIYSISQSEMYRNAEMKLGLDECGQYVPKTQRGERSSGDARTLSLPSTTLKVRMTALLEDKREAIENACKRHGVVRMHVFGSALREDDSPDESDVDLLVDFGSMEPYARVEAYFALLDDLREILRQDVDLVVVGAVKNRYIAEDIDRTKQTLYAA
jgi:uncharacterized protein